MIRSLLAVAPCLLAGCYFVRQFGGQMEIVTGQEPLDQVIESDRLSGDEARKLLVISEVRRFAFGRLGLSESDNYTTFYDTKGRPVSHLLSACAQDRFQAYTWSFPIAGTFSYKGFFQAKDAREEALELERSGYDTSLSEVSAYSTLGWFRDPVFSGMLRRTEASLASLVIHELSHGTVHAPGATDFNESMATFIGNQGALEFLENRYGPGAAEVTAALRQFEDDRLFDAFIAALYDRLQELYQGPLPREEKLRRREQIFAAARHEFTRLKPSFHAPTYFFFERMKLDNAEILALRRYGRTHEFSRLFEQAGRSWVVFLSWMRAAAASSDPEAFCRNLDTGTDSPRNTRNAPKESKQ